MDRQEAQRVLKRLREFKSDPESLLQQAEEVYSQATEGFTVEQLTKTGEPISVMQKAPAVGVQALQFKLTVVKFLIEHSGEDEQEVAQEALLPDWGELKKHG